MPSRIQQADVLVAADLEQKVRNRITSLSYLPTTIAVAMKFVELGKDPDAEPADYARIIEADSSLSSKVLALANSPWFGIRNKVTTVKMAVNLLGLGTVRTMAISYCVAGLHNELKLAPEESRMFWESALCKAVAAKQFAHMYDEKTADEAFIGGMFQDFAIPVMYSLAKEEVTAILQDGTISSQIQIQRERELFHLDHSEIGRILAQKLELPDCFVDAVAFHHNHDQLTDLMENEVVGEAVYVASLFPHVLNVWNQTDAETVCAYLDERFANTENSSAGFLEAVQKEFNSIYRYFENSEAPANRLAELMVEAAREQADNTTHLVRTVQQLMQEAASMGLEMHQLIQNQNQLEDKASRDPLTGVLNRDGFFSRADELLTKAARYQLPMAIIYADIDKFKPINDTLGHEFGDRALKAVASHMSECVRQHDLIGRLGGDEFALLLYDCKEPEARQIARKILDAVAAQVIGRGKRNLRITTSMGLLAVQPSDEVRPCDLLLRVADKLMYRAKQAGGNRTECRVV
ncbi:MAG TPA: diguanylate cyclase [Phycisphaerae bacterium]|nr:diguanylate cyclase [Phycisphaerae bacterium]